MWFGDLAFKTAPNVEPIGRTASANVHCHNKASELGALTQENAVHKLMSETLMCK
jgi:hypothetical protein